ncbi:MAG TPA: sigma-70 family RNA polymerase sigma factor [Phototrophicaceae bacterium]|nr:sigma-70 family RNA polymerase sigma factor [Phototrophicaceae bacterium]
MKQAQVGNKEAVSILYEAYTQSIFQYIFYRVDSKQIAEDMTAEVFLRMIRGLPGYQDQGLPFGAWLFRIAANQLADYYRENKRITFTLISDEYRSDETDPFERLDKKEERARLHQALQQLPFDYQNILVLRFIRNLSHTEVAMILDKSEVNVRTLQHRALSALAKVMGIKNRQRSYLRGDKFQ